ncbi:hypothetical protein [Polynucleobacter sp. MWH-UH2A]|uniref:hypothetical protein n=1 Tax=Polynucleobacter sp. MWH-UH2A TaxID=1855617 RepID=UPI001BFEC90F|nr:hypothetical protein [Polynucleobacter sp. MWH-UH2A]QWD64654.1 hypothetical protein IC571_03215 [Polynucleobacter sp. MWH-UH2A]
MFTISRFSLFLIIVFTCKTSFASDSHASVEASHAEVTKTSSSNNGEPFVGPSSEAKKLYRRYKKANDKTITAIACVRSPKCVDPEDEVLRYSKEALRILQKLDELSAEGDIQANYYRGLIAYERGVYYDSQAEIITHPDFILTATVYRRYAKQQFLLAEKYLALPAKEKNAYACQYLGNVYSSTILGAPRKDKATNYYYTAAIEFINQGNKIDGAKMYNAMKENANPADSRIVEVYAKLHNEEPIASWRKLPSDLVQKPTNKKVQQH